MTSPPPHNPLSDNWSSDPADEQWFDTLLDEFLNQRSPKKLDAGNLFKRASASESATRLDRCSEVAASDLAAIQALDLFGGTHHVNPNAPPGQLSAATPVMARRALIGVIAALAASLLIAMGVMLTHDRSSFSVLPGAKIANTPLKQDAITTAQASDNSQSVATNTIENDWNRDKIVPSRNPSDFGPLPFALDQPKIVQSNSNSAAVRPRSWNADRTQILITTDSQFDQLWQRHESQPTAWADSATWATRAQFSLTGESLGAEEASRIAQDIDESDEPLAAKRVWVSQVMQSDAFIAHWSQKLSESYFGFRAEEEAATTAIASALRAEESILPLWKSFLTIRAMGSETSQKAAQSTGLWWKKFAANVSLKNDSDPRLMASELLTRWHGNQAGCIQCHSDDASRVEIDADLKQQYWALAGLLNKVEFVRTEEDICFKIKQDSRYDLFYERANGQLQLAEPGFPIAGKSQTEIERAGSENPLDQNDLADSIGRWGDWAAEDSNVAAALVDSLWLGVFNRPLKLEVATGVEPARNELDDLRDFYAAELLQSSPQKDSLRQIIETLLLSKPFIAPQADATPAWYLTASQNSVISLRQAEINFASFTAAIEPELRSLDGQLAWLNRTGQINRPAPIVLAQPLPAFPKTAESMDADLAASNSAKKLTDPEATMTGGQLQWLLRSRHPQPEVALWIETLSNSKLTWEQAVDHTYFSTNATKASEEKQIAARKMLDLSGSRQLAISRMLAADSK